MSQFIICTAATIALALALWALLLGWRKYIYWLDNLDDRMLICSL